MYHQQSSVRHFIQIHHLKIILKGAHVYKQEYKECYLTHEVKSQKLMREAKFDQTTVRTHTDCRQNLRKWLCLESIPFQSLSQIGHMHKPIAVLEKTLNGISQHLSFCIN